MGNLLPAVIKHSGISRKTHAPGTAAAHYRYINRQRDTSYSYAERMPTNWHKAQRWLDHREQSIRKDGRVCDKLTIVFPFGMEQEHAVEACRLFGFRATQGKASFHFTLQNFGENNPHAHMILVDADQETGRRVFGTTKLGSTDRLRDLWVDACNSTLEEHGYKTRIANMTWEQIHELEAQNDNVSPEASQTALEPEPEPVENGEPEVAMEARVQQALYFDRELKLLRSQREMLKQLQYDADHHRQRADQLRDRTDELKTTLIGMETTLGIAKTQANYFTKSNGKLKGFELLGWKSPKRVAGEHAKEALELAAMQATVKQFDHDITKEQAQREDTEAKAYEQKRDALAFFLRTRGTEQDMDQSDKDMEAARAERMKDITPENVAELYEQGKLTEGQYKEALNMMGVDEEKEEGMGY
jgi:hypothetical protein